MKGADGVCEKEVYRETLCWLELPIVSCLFSLANTRLFLNFDEFKMQIKLPNMYGLFMLEPLHNVYLGISYVVRRGTIT